MMMDEEDEDELDLNHLKLLKEGLTCY